MLLSSKAESSWLCRGEPFRVVPRVAHQRPSSLRQMLVANPDIARRLALSEHTIHRHLANILRKLNLSSRAAAVAWGVRAGLI